MKKALIAILLLALLLCGCNSENTASIVYNDISNAISEFDTEETIHISQPEESETSQTNTSEEMVDESNSNDSFRIKYKKYRYMEKDIVILSLENNTANNYSVTVTGSYFDANKNLLQTETHSFEGIASGCQNYFLFAPNMIFDTFQYTLDYIEYQGECLTAGLTAKFSELREEWWPLAQVTGDYITEYPYINASILYHNSGKAGVCISAVGIAFDEKGKILDIEAQGSIAVDAGKTASSAMTLYYELTTNNFTWPERFKGKVTAIVVLVDAKSTFENLTPAIQVYSQFDTFAKEK